MFLLCTTRRRRLTRPTWAFPVHIQTHILWGQEPMRRKHSPFPSAWPLHPWGLQTPQLQSSFFLRVASGDWYLRNFLAQRCWRRMMVPLQFPYHQNAINCPLGVNFGKVTRNDTRPPTSWASARSHCSERCGSHWRSRNDLWLCATHGTAEPGVRVHGIMMMPGKQGTLNIDLTTKPTAPA